MNKLTVILLSICIFLNVSNSLAQKEKKDSVILQAMPDESMPIYATFLSANIGIGQYMTIKEPGFFNPNGVKNLHFSMETQQFLRHRFHISIDHELLYNGDRLNGPSGKATYSSSSSEGQGNEFFNYRGGYSFVYASGLNSKEIYRHPFSFIRKAKGVIGVTDHLHKQIFVDFQYSRTQQQMDVGFDSAFVKEITGVTPVVERTEIIPINMTVSVPSIVIGHSWSKEWKTFYFENGERVDRSRNVKYTLGVTLAPEPPPPAFIYRIADGKEPELVQIDPNYQIDLNKFFLPSNVGGYFAFEAWNFLSAPMFLSVELGVRPGLGGNVSNGFDRTLDFGYLQFRLGYRFEQKFKAN